MGHLWANVIAGLLKNHIKQILTMPDRTSGLLKAHVVGRRIYGPSEFRLWTICIVNGPPFWPAKTSGLFGIIRAQFHFQPIKRPCFYGLEIFTAVNGVLLLRAQIMFRPFKGPLWARTYQKNMKAYVDLGPDIISGLHANSARNRFYPNWNGPTNVGMLGSYEAFSRIHY